MYKFEFNHDSVGSKSLYRCVSHEGCPRFLRLVSRSSVDDTTEVVLEQSGHHDGSDTCAKKSGIPLRLKREIDSILCGGAGPKKCQKILHQRYKGDGNTLALIPTETQLKNRKAQLLIKIEGA